MRKPAYILMLSLLLFGCAGAPKPIPDGYSGPLSSIHDTQKTVSSTRVHFFQLTKVNGRTVKTSSWASYEHDRNHNRNFYDALTKKIWTRLISRQVPAGKSVLTIEGVTHLSADIFALTGDMYYVQGDVTVELKEGNKYYVKGILSEDYSAVWVQDDQGNIVSDKIEKK